jgi:Mg/Co/Ni transporter MgtE
MAVTLTAILSTAGCLRAVLLTGTNLSETIAITSSLALIVFTSICLGAILPLLLQRMKLDPAHSSTTIQVVMDILGVVFTVQVSLWTLGVLLTSSSPVSNTGSQLDVDAPTIAQVDDLLKKLADSN